MTPIHHLHRNAGFSLVELMVAMTLGLILLAGVVSVVVNTSASHSELSKASRQMDNGRYAIQVLREDIRHAGYYGQFHELLVPPAIAPDPCLTTQADLLAGMRLPIQGYRDGTGLAAACVPGRVAGTDVLVIRRVATQVTATGDMEADVFYLQSRPTNLVLQTGPYNAAAFNLVNLDGSPAEIRRFLVHIYYIRDCSNCAGGGDGIPTLVRRELQAGGLGTPQPLSGGIETLRLAYGIDTSGNGQVDNVISNAAPSLNQMANIMTLEIGLLARNVEPTPGYSDAKVYTLAGVDLGPSGDGFKRHAYTTLARTVNLSDRRQLQ